MTFRQCLLEKSWPDIPVVWQTTSWIPEKLAVVGKSLKIYAVDGWIVKTVSTAAIETVPDYHKIVRRHRRQTGDSLPKEPRKDA